VFKKLLQPLLHLGFLFTRPLTVGVRGICYNAESNSILLVKHTYSEGWALPGGGVEVGESMLTALKRELSEETGLECKSARVLDTYHNSSISKRDHVVIYLVEEWREEPAHEPPELEIAETAWFGLDDLPEGLSPCTECGLQRYELTRS
jgi:8-oxo-dGTP pyrophosphatase MutT (NUDIX family)